MVLGNPHYLWLLLLILPAAGLAVYHYFHGSRDLFKLGGKWRYESLINVFIVKNFFIFLFFIFFIFFSVLALVDIRWDEQLVEDEREGYEIVLLIDISQSMLADDIYPSRLQAAVKKIEWLIHSLPDVKFSVVVFKGKAVRVLPVTDDVYALSLFLNTLSPGLITVPGSNMEDGINTALDSFTQAGKYQLVVLFSDGENMNGNPLAAAKKAGAAGVPVIPVVTGKDQGANIRLGPAHYLRKEDGRMVVTKADEKLLAEIAESSNGKLYQLNTFTNIKNELLYLAKTIESENIDKGLKPVKQEKFEIFLATGLFFLILSVLTRGIRWKKIT